MLSGLLSDRLGYLGYPPSLKTVLARGRQGFMVMVGGIQHRMGDIGDTRIIIFQSSVLIKLHPVSFLVSSR